jgi:hypothetical protein
MMAWRILAETHSLTTTMTILSQSTNQTSHVRCCSVDPKAPARPGLSFTPAASSSRMPAIAASRVAAYAIRALPDLWLGVGSERLETEAL